MQPTRFRFLAPGLLAGLLAAPLCAAEPDAPADPATITKRYFGITSEALDCPPPADGVIQVCGKRKGPSLRIEIPDRPTSNPDNKMTALGNSGIGHGSGGGVTMRVCFLQKCPKKLYFFDIAALPEAPPDSDADKISRGEMRAH